MTPAEQPKSNDNDPEDYDPTWDVVLDPEDLEVQTIRDTKDPREEDFPLEEESDAFCFLARYGDDLDPVSYSLLADMLPQLGY